MKERQAKWDKRFMDVAQLVSGWSKDPSTQVGSVIVNSDRRIVATGYNGFPSGVKDDWELYADRTYKYAHIVHAELNAVLNTTSSLEGCTLYVTMPCCHECAKAVIQSGISRVVYQRICEQTRSERWLESIQIAWSMFMESGVDVEEL